MRVSYRYSARRFGALSPGLRFDGRGYRGLLGARGLCRSFAVSTIDSAEREILVSAYQLTVGPGAVGALIRANERGVDVRLLADREAPSERASGLTRWPWRVCQCG